MKLKTLEKLIEQKSTAKIRSKIVTLQVADIAEFINELNLKDALLVFRLLPKNLAAEVFSFVEVERQSEISLLVNEDELKDLIEKLNFDDKIDLLEEMPAYVVKKILKNTSENERKLINLFLNYPENSAGSIMTIEYVDLKKTMTIQDAMNRIRTIGVGKETIYTSYVINNERKLEGIISLKDIVLGNVDQRIEEIMKKEFISVNTSDDQEHIAKAFKKYNLLSMPVVDNEQRLVGIITIDDVVDVIEEETTEDFQKMAGTTPTDEEYMNMTPFSLAKKRILWLVVLMFSALITEFITDRNSYITSSFVVLVGVMPMLMSTGGNAGGQSSTLIIRGLTLGDIKFKDFFKVMFKEFRVGIILGVTLGILNFCRILLLENDIKLATIVGLTLISTTTIAALMGGILPIIAIKLKLDPAIMASPMITTITDATTLIVFFTIASKILL
jgi:magnesium transporter